MRKETGRLILCGICAGVVNGLFGAAGGMVLVPMLGAFTAIPDNALFAASLCIMLPICATSIAMRALEEALPIWPALPYLIGSALGGYFAGKYRSKIPTLWLHRLLGILILWGGIRYLC